MTMKRLPVTLKQRRGSGEGLQYIADYLGAAHQSEVVDKVFRAAYGSVASVAVFQMQDVLKLDNWVRDEHTEYGGEKLEMEDEAGGSLERNRRLPGMAGRYIRPVSRKAG